MVAILQALEDSGVLHPILQYAFLNETSTTLFNGLCHISLNNVSPKHAGRKAHLIQVREHHFRCFKIDTGISDTDTMFQSCWAAQFKRRNVLTPFVDVGLDHYTGN